MIRKTVGCFFVVAAWLSWQPAAQTADVLEAAKKEGTVVFYGTISADDQVKLAQAFQAKFPFLKLQSFRGNSERVVHRVLNEGRAGSHLVDAIGLDGVNAWALKEKGFLQPHRSKETEAFAQEFRDPESLLPCCIYVTTSVIGYNTKMVSKQDAPKSFNDLLNSRWKGNLGMDSDSSEWFGALMSIWGKEKTIQYFRSLMKQEPSLRRGRTLITQLMAAGEFPVAVEVFAHRVLEFQDQGVPVEIVLADPVIVRPWHILLARRAPHPNAARIFMDYVLLAEGQQVIAQLGRTSVRPGVKTKHPRLVEGVKLHPVKPESAKDHEEMSKLYYSIVK